MGKYRAGSCKSRLQWGYFSLTYRGRAGVFLFFCFLLVVQSAGSALIRSQSTGLWNSADIWVEGVIPSLSDDVQISSEVTIAEGSVVEVNSLTITQNGKLNIYGTMIVRGDLVMDNNGSELITGPGASVFVFGNVLLGNLVTLDMSSYFIVLGDFLRSGANNQGSVSVSGAQVYIFGTVDSSWDNFTGCSSGSYDGTTTSIDDDCDAGTFDDFLALVDPEDLPDGLYQQIISCNPAPSAVISGEAEICDDGSMANLTIAFTGNAPWNITILRDGEPFMNVSDIYDNPYFLPVSVAGTYTIGAVHNSVCSGTVAGTATVVVNAVPQTSGIETD